MLSPVPTKPYLSTNTYLHQPLLPFCPHLSHQLSGGFPATPPTSSRYSMHVFMGSLALSGCSELWPRFVGPRLTILGNLGLYSLRQHLGCSCHCNHSAIFGCVHRGGHPTTRLALRHFPCPDHQTARLPSPEVAQISLLLITAAALQVTIQVDYINRLYSPK